MGWGGSRMQEEIGVSLQSTVGVCREQVQSERSGIKEGEGERQDRPWLKAHQAFCGQMKG